MWGGIINTILNKINPDRPAKLARSQILAKYGTPDAAYQKKYCITWDIKQDFPLFPAHQIFLNKDFKDKLFEAFTELNEEGLLSEIKTYDGCLVVRNTRGSTLISLHSWGLAMDLNASVEKLGQTTTNWSDRFIEIMTAHVYWGGQFHGRVDNMHFSLLGE